MRGKPEGVRAPMYKNHFVIMDLKKLSIEQQKKAIEHQLGANMFFHHLLAFSVIREDHDRIYYHDIFNNPSDERIKIMETMHDGIRDRFYKADTDPSEEIYDENVLQKITDSGKERVVGAVRDAQIVDDKKYSSTDSVDAGLRSDYIVAIDSWLRKHPFLQHLERELEFIEKPVRLAR